MFCIKFELCLPLIALFGEASRSDEEDEKFDDFFFESEFFVLASGIPRNGDSPGFVLPPPLSPELPVLPGRPELPGLVSSSSLGVDVRDHFVTTCKRRRISEISFLNF